MKIKKLSFDIIGKMAKSELPALLYRDYLIRLGNHTATFQSFGDYVQSCYEKTVKNKEERDKLAGLEL